MSIYNHKQSYPQGSLVQFEIVSEILKDNPLKDPHKRMVFVYLPAAYDEVDIELPVMYYLAAYTNSGTGVVTWRAFTESITERLDRLIAEDKMGATIVVMPDCFTCLGGNQYLDSAAVGNYASFIVEEVVPVVEENFRVKPGWQHRAVLGKSSGGFAAIRFAMDFPGFWGAIANQSGDAGFDVLYQRDFPTVANVLSNYKGDIQHFIQRFWQAKKKHGTDILTLMMICMAATYDPQAEIELPFDLHTCEIKPKRWQNWLTHDPINRVKNAADGLQQLNGLFMDCGFRDQFMLHYGMRRLSNELEKYNITHTYEEFNGTHSSIDYRLDISLAYLYDKIKVV
ncbi:MAG: esterase family protein [Proteobacteria bacterium]|nr:esterase family protein [Pseudomonadota bacterium]